MTYNFSRSAAIRRPEGRLTAKAGEFLSDDAIRRTAPSVFAETAHNSRSDRFQPIPTFRVLEAMRKEGFGVTEVMQSRSRDASRREFTKHLLRVSKTAYKPAKARRVGDVFPQVTLTNANDGSSAYHLRVGLLKLICLNGMTVDAGQADGVRVSHQGDVVSKVIEGSYRVLDDSIHAIDQAENWTGITLDARQRDAFAQAARVIRWGDAEGNLPDRLPITTDQILRSRRHEDDRDDLWSVFNRVQENVVRGGIQAIQITPDNSTRRYTSRPINGIDGDLKLNQGLWTLARALGEQFAA